MKNNKTSARSNVLVLQPVLNLNPRAMINRHASGAMKRRTTAKKHLVTSNRHIYQRATS